MAKANNKKEKKRVKLDGNFWVSIIFLVIMVMSIAGFAMISGGGYSSSGSSNNLPSDLDLQQFDQDGQIFWGAIRNNEQFIFMDIDIPEADTKALDIANQIKSKNMIKISNDNFDASSQLILEKALTGLKIPYSISNETICDENTLLLTYNLNTTGDCIQLVANETSAYQTSNDVVYHLIK